MIRRTPNRLFRARAGAILLVVLTLLALFAVVGLSFALYAQSEATAARIKREAANAESKPDPYPAINAFLGQLLFDTTDNGSDAMSAVRGHSLGRGRYGYRTDPANPGNPVGPMAAAYAGTGPIADTQDPGFAPGGVTVSRSTVINYAYRPTSGYVVDPEWVQPTLRADPAQPRTGATYYGKNANYTYPDLNNAFLAVVDPKTGAVVQPSFHRNWLFDLSKPSTDPLWVNPENRLKLLRPRPQEHTAAFPMPPLNPDGTITGDVQNLRYANGLQKNDSVWLDVNAPVFEYRGKKVKALIAALILDLNARVNANAAGAGTSTAARSGMGFGPHEINLGQLLLGTQKDTEIGSATTAKYGAATPPTERYTNQAKARWDGGRLPPQYGLIEWNPTGSSVSKPALPAAGGLSPFPTYPAGYATTAAALGTQETNHPLQFSPAQWPALPGAIAPASATTHVFGPDELKAVFSHFSWGTARKPGTELVSVFNTSLGKTGPAASGDTQASGFGRMALTSYSSTVARPSLAVRTGPNPSDVAKLPPVDLARVLPDYRKDETQPFGLNNQFSAQVSGTAGSDYGKYAKARQARQNLARDIFVRIAAVAQWGAGGMPPLQPLVDGTAVAYNPGSGYFTLNGPAPDQLNALRQCAQAAANAVDYLDTDDVMTTFVWNPTVTGGYLYNDATAAQSLGVTAFPDPSADAALFQNAAGVQYLADRAVFGFEVPRAVINEAFAVVTNSRSETFPATPPAVLGNPTPQQNFKKKFWAELMNPLPTDTDPVLSDAGAARLQVSTTATPAPAGATASFSPYKFEVYEQSAAGAQPFSQFLQTTPGNVTGDPAYAGGPPSPYTKVVDVTDFQTASGQPALNAAWAGGEQDQNYLIKPIGTGPNPASGNKGFFVLGPQDDLPEAGPGSSQVSSRLPDSPTRAGPQNVMMVDTGVKSQADIGNLTAKTNTFVLRRLANPYAAANVPGPTFNATQAPNPYVTVDVQDQVPTADRIDWDGGGMNRHTPAQPDVQAAGKKHPYAAANIAPQGTIVPAGPPARSQVGQTFFAMNTAAENTSGFQWLAHLDRPPVNGVELAGVAFFSPAAVTTQFWQGGFYQGHIASAGWAGTATNTGFADLYKALDVLTVRSRLAGIPVGGPEPGKVNPNTIWDDWSAGGTNYYSRVLAAVADPTQANQFAATDVYRMWADIKAARTLTGATAGKTVNEDTAGTPGTDRPFRGFNTTTSQIQDTFLRQSTNAPGAGVFTMAPPAAGTNSHPMFQAEPLRKMLNSLTPTSDSFLVLVTVGFFEVKGTTGTGTFTIPMLGKEVYDEIPGDLRVQLGAVVDRGMMTIKDVDSQTNATTPGAAPWFTALTADAGPDDPTVPGYTGRVPLTVAGSFDAPNTAALIYANGEPVRIFAGDKIRIGFGDLNTTPPWGSTADGTDGEWVSVESVAQVATPANSGTVTVTVTRPDGNKSKPVLNRPHPAGSPVSNAVLGNPGPQTGFDYRNPAYRAILPAATGAFPVPKP